MKPLTIKIGVVCSALSLTLLPLSSWAVSVATSPNTPEAVTSPPVTTPPPPAVVPAPPPDSATPPAPYSSPSKLSYTAREVVKLVSAGVPEDVIKTFIQNSPYTFSLSPDAIIELHGMGISNGLMTEMLSHDRTLMASAPMQQPFPPQVPMAVPQAVPQEPQQPAAVPYGAYGDQYSDQSALADNTDYYDQLAPYGDWNYVPGYGYGWSPYAGMDNWSYPWWLMNSWGGGWIWIGNAGWCWFPHNQFHNHFHFHNHDMNHNHDMKNNNHMNNHMNNFNHVSHFNNFNHMNNFNRQFNNNFAAGQPHFSGRNNFQAFQPHFAHSTGGPQISSHMTGGMPGGHMGGGMGGGHMGGGGGGGHR